MKMKKANILMIDDIPSNLHLLSEIFKEEYNIFIATDGVIGLEIASGDTTPDVILLDVMMPEMDGYEVLKRLKANPLTAMIPVLFLSALETEESQEYGFSLGAVDYITKPYNPIIVKRRVETHLRIKTLYHDMIEENSRLISQIAAFETSNGSDNISLFHKLFNITRDGVVLTDANETIISVNNAFTDITGYTIEEIRGQSTRILKSHRHDPLFYQQMWKSIQESGYWSGQIYNSKKDGEIYQELLNISAVQDNSGTVKYYLGVFNDITHLKKAKETIDQLKLHDQLTGLPNRSLFYEHLNQVINTARASEKYASALTLDLNNFREINVVGGVVLGDAILRKLSHLLVSIVENETIVAHINSDLFALVFYNLFETKEAAANFIYHKALSINQAIKKYSLELENDMYKISPSIGITTINGNDKELVIADVIRELESARLEAKKNNNRNIVLYDKTIEDSLKNKIFQEQELLQAIQNEDFELFVQEQFGQNKQFHGLEVLIRWKHKHKGYIPPSEFIPLAESTHHIIDIDRWVLNSSFQLLKRLRLEHGIDVHISVNVSAQEFMNAQFIEDVQHLCEIHDYKADSMLIEITEYIMIDNMEQVISTTENLKRLGIGISIDDFGTGYSNLHYMQYLPITELKIDKSFVDTLLEDEKSQKLLETINELAKKLEFRLVVEGVETEEQAKWIFLMNPEIIIQGYLYSRPVSVDKWLELYNSNR